MEGNKGGKYILKNKLGDKIEHREDNENTYATTKTLAYLRLNCLSFFVHVHIFLKNEVIVLKKV